MLVKKFKPGKGPNFVNHQNKYDGANMFHFGARIVYNGIRIAFRGGRGPIPRPPN